MGVPRLEPRTDVEKALLEHLKNEASLLRAIRKLFPLERLILNHILEAGGVIRYDELILRHGADDETAWHWAYEVPNTPLERVRRTGLVHAGKYKLGRRAHRVAVIPVDLREPVRNAISSLAG